MSKDKLQPATSAYEYEVNIAVHRSVLPLAHACIRRFDGCQSTKCADGCRHSPAQYVPSEQLTLFYARWPTSIKLILDRFQFIDHF